MDERSSVITVGGTEYELLLTTKATKEIGKKYGGLSDLGDKLMNAENFETAIDELIWLITLLANQPILIHNIRHPDEKKERSPSAEQMKRAISPRSRHTVLRTLTKLLRTPRLHPLMLRLRQIRMLQ